MSTIVYQELQPCHESHFVESTRLSLKLNSPKPNLSPSLLGLPQTSNNSSQDLSLKSDTGADNRSSYSNMFGWGDIEALSSSRRETMEKEQPVYIHPLAKRSSSTLSERSLEMCTESLGCETGSCIMESSIFFPLSTNERRKPQPKKEVKPVNFPPPLTTISGSNSIHVKHHREDGRLVIKAVSAPPMQSYLQAERSDGRLRLSLLRDYSSDINDSSSDDEDDSSCACETSENNEVQLEGHVRLEDNKGKKVDVEKNMLKEKEIDTYVRDDVNGIKRHLDVKMGLGKIQRQSRCKEGGKGSRRLINWEPFWVAT